MSYGIKETLSIMKNDPRAKDKTEDISFNRFFNEYSHKANEMGLLSKCKLCGKDISGRKNSHSVPQLVLKNIKGDGHYCQITCALGEGMIFGPLGRVNRSGLNNTGTFHLLCDTCENTTFRDYENEQFLFNLSNNKIELLTDKILAQMMLKSALRERYKKEFSKNIFILINETAAKNGLPLNIETKSDELNIKEYDFYIDKCQDILKNDKTNMFNIFYFDVLDHSSSIACQTLLAIQKTVTNEIINDVYNYDPKYNIVLSHFVIFPLKEKTICLAYCLKEETPRLLPYISYFKTLNTTSKRKIFQSTLFMYTEEVYTNEETIEKLQKDDLTIEYIKSAIENGTTTKSLLSKNILIDKPKLVAPNNFRKVKFFL